MKKVLLLLSMMFLFACGGSEGEKKPQEDTTEKAQEVASTKTEDQVLNLFLPAEPKTLDISRSTDTYSSTILALTNEGLVRGEVGEKGMDNIVGAGAKSWETTEDGMVWTFHLRDKAKWADGQPVTAKDYYYGITRTLNPSVGSSYAFLLYPIKGAQAYNESKGDVSGVGVEVVDDYTLKITLENPTPYFIELAYFKVMYPQRQDIVEKYGDAYGSEGNQILSNGPFILKEWVHSNKVVLEKNPGFWDQENYKLSQINFAIVSDENSRMNLIASGQVDIGAADKPEWIKQFMDSGDFYNMRRYSLGTNYSLFNTQSRYFKNAKIRKAFSLALDRDVINKVMFNNNFDPAYGWVSKGIQIGHKDYRVEVPGPIEKLKAENPDPKALLIEGLTELGEDTNPENVTITYLASGTSGWSRKYSELLQQMLQTNLGVKIAAEFVEWPVYQKRNDELDYEMGGQAWTGDYNDPNTFLDMWVSTAGIVNNGWKNDRYDELIRKAGKTDNQEERLQYFKEAEEILLYDEAVIAPTLYRVTNTYIRNYVKGYNPTTVAPYTYKGVYIEGRK